MQHESVVNVQSFKVVFDLETSVTVSCFEHDIVTTRVVKSLRLVIKVLMVKFGLKGGIIGQVQIFESNLTKNSNLIFKFGKILQKCGIKS